MITARYRVYTYEDYCRSVKPKSKWDELDKCWCYDTAEKNDSWFDLEDVFISAAEEAFYDWGWEYGWDNDSPTFVAIGEDGKVYKAELELEHRPEFYCGTVKEVLNES
jgi:hypothetical protein